MASEIAQIGLFSTLKMGAKNARYIYFLLMLYVPMTPFGTKWVKSGSYTTNKISSARALKRAFLTGTKQQGKPDENYGRKPALSDRRERNDRREQKGRGRSSTRPRLSPVRKTSQNTTGIIENEKLYSFLRNEKPATIRPQLMDCKNIFIDWITIKEKHAGKYTEINGGRVIKIDQDGELVFDCPTTRKIQGSHDSSARVRITSTEMEISFNPSRWNRRENLFGVTYEESIATVNKLLNTLNQPAIETGKQHMAQSSRKITYIYTGAQITRLDATLNLEIGSASELDSYMRHLFRMKMPQVKTRRKGETVYYGKSSKRKILKVYPKHKELYFRAKDSTDEKYVLKVARHCEEVGLARVEVRLGRDYLRDHGLRATGNVTQKRIEKIMLSESKRVRQDIEEVDVTELSRSELGTLMIWMGGYDLKNMMSQAAWYKHRKAIKKYTGYDIAHEVTRLEVEPTRITIKAAVPPDWYEMPNIKQETMKLVK